MKIEQIKIEDLKPYERNAGKHEAEIRRLEDAIRRTRSDRLRRDYGKAVRRMKKELRAYDLNRNL